MCCQTTSAPAAIASSAMIPARLTSSRWPRLASALAARASTWGTGVNSTIVSPKARTSPPKRWMASACAVSCSSFITG